MRPLNLLADEDGNLVNRDPQDHHRNRRVNLIAFRIISRDSLLKVVGIIACVRTLVERVRDRAVHRRQGEKNSWTVARSEQSCRIFKNVNDGLHNSGSRIKYLRCLHFKLDPAFDQVECACIITVDGVDTDASITRLQLH